MRVVKATPAVTVPVPAVKVAPDPRTPVKGKIGATTAAPGPHSWKVAAKVSTRGSLAPPELHGGDMVPEGAKEWTKECPVSPHSWS